VSAWSAVFAVFLFLFHAGQGLAAIESADKVLVIKSERRMLLLKGEKVLRSYEIALGKDPEGPKMCRGDKKTPEGTYTLDRRNPSSRFYRSIHISYPGKNDLENARRHKVSPGGDVMIHGLPNGKGRMGELHSVLDWTNGCIAVTNAQMDEIWRMVPNGTPIEIRP
jgi:murein L,D-transpeptidase YafK